MKLRPTVRLVFQLSIGMYCGVRFIAGRNESTPAKRVRKAEWRLTAAPTEFPKSDTAKLHEAENFLSGAMLMEARPSVQE